MSFHAPERFRLRKGEFATTEADGNCGMFLFPAGIKRQYLLRAIASDGQGWEELGLLLPAWEHVSVSTAVRCPTWEEMCWIKTLFWDDEDLVMQLHPRKSDYINQHPFCLHLWRPIGVGIPMPPWQTVGSQKRSA